MADPYVGEIRPFAFGFAPLGWLACNGQSVSVAQYQALYAVIGNIYGGTPNQTFNLPDLQGRAPVGMGTGPGLTPRNLNDKFGSEKVALTLNQMPVHTHTASAEQENATTPNPQGMIVAASSTTTKFYKDSPQAANIVAMNGATVQAFAGSGQPHENRQPYQVLNFCINYDGNFPERP